MNSPLTPVSGLRADRRAIVAHFVVRRKISHKAIWDFFNSIRQKADARRHMGLLRPQPTEITPNPRSDSARREQCRLHGKKVLRRSLKCISSKFVKRYACGVSLMSLLLGGDRFCPHNAGAAATSSCHIGGKARKRADDQIVDCPERRCCQQ